MNTMVFIAESRSHHMDLPPFFASRVLPALVRQATQQVIVVMDGNEVSSLPDSTPGARIISRKAGRSFIADWWWKHITLRRIMHDHNIRLLLAVNNILPTGSRSPKRGRVKQGVYFENDLASVDKKMIAKAQVFFGHTRQENDGNRLGGPALIPVYRPARDGFAPLGHEEKQRVAEQFASGRTFFLYAGPIGSALLDMIKAFSVFKKRQKSDWKLVLAGRGNRSDAAFIKSLAHYRYKDDVVVLERTTDAQLATLAAAAYAFVFTESNTAEFLPEVFASGTPVLAPDADAFRGDWHEALMFYQPGSQTAIAEAMMTIYKDESARGRMIAKGLTIQASRSWDHMAQVMLRALAGV